MAKIYKIALVFLFFSLLPITAEAATLSFSPSSGDYAVGQTLSVSIYVSSVGQSMNAASGVISFPQDKLEIVSLSKTGSIFNLWVQEPLFSNSAGTVNFEGIVLNPGFIGVSGKIITINFKVKAAGTALLNFFSGSVLANDGKGTNILASLGNAQFSLGGAALAIPESTTLSIIYDTPSAPVISSSTNPDFNKWYSNKNPDFFWVAPSDATAVRLLYDKYPNSLPSIVYSPPISKKQLENIKDGVYYFHVQLKNDKGWGGIAHFRFQIDTNQPEPFIIKFIDGNETKNPMPTVIFDTTDSLSGVDYYKIKIGEGDFFSVAPEIIKSNPYTLPLQDPGKRNILVQAFDKAGNYTVATEEFIIKPLQTPVFTEYPREIISGEELKVKGKTEYPNSKVVIWLQRDKDDPKSFKVDSDKDGNFVFITDGQLQNGVYNLWAEVIDTRGAKSLLTEKITIAVSMTAFLRIGTGAISFLAVMIPLVALIFALLFILWYGWHKFSLMRKRLRKEVREAESSLHKAFGLLRDDIQKQIRMLEKISTKRELTEKEEKIIKQLRKDLDDAEKFVKKEIKDIEKEVK